MALLSVNAINKSFFSQRALKDVSFDAQAGEVVGLLGANGAGKSTLLKIIGGTLNADSGSICLDGQEITRSSPQIALSLGITSVYQELNLFSHRTVAENLFIGREIKTRFGTIDWKETNRRAQLILDEHELDIKAGSLVSSLSVAKQHMVEIARAFNENPKLLLLDEPTSALAETEIEWLFKKIQEAAGRGVTVIYVSHRLDEVTRICKRNVILRDGEVVHVSHGPMDKADTIHHIVGHDVVLNKAFTEKNNREVVFEVRQIQSQAGGEAEFCVRRGEILGVAGLVGSGRTELLHSLFGIDQQVFNLGEIRKDGRLIRIDTPADAIRHGIMLVPEDRKLSGLFLNESARFNVAASTLDRRSSTGLVDTRQEMEAVTGSANRVMLDPRRLEHLVRQLSGGNQQKVVLAKTLLANADVLLLDEPTRGVDIGAREEIYEIIRQLAESGKSILLVTSDWEELIFLSHRVIVLSDQRIVGQVEEDITEAAILQVAETTHAPKAKRRSQEAAGLKQLYERVFASTGSNFILLILILLAGLMTGSAINPYFRTWLNFSNLFGQSMPLIILSLGQLIVIIAGGIDISSGALMAASGVIGLTLMNDLGFPPWAGVGLILLFGVVVGFANAFLIQSARVDPFVVTIGMMLVLEGVALIVTPKPIGPAPQIFKTLFNGDVFGIPAALILLVILLAVFSFLLRYTPLGRRFFAVGENKQYSFNVGFNVNRVVFLSYIFCSLMSVLAAVYILGRFGAADPVLGPGMELEAIACVLIGGATLAGGRGSIAGTVSGVFVLGVLANLLSLMDINVWYQEVIRGVMLLVIIASYEKVVRQKEKVQ